MTDIESVRAQLAADEAAHSAQVSAQAVTKAEERLEVAQSEHLKAAKAELAAQDDEARAERELKDARKTAADDRRAADKAAVPDEAAPARS